MDDKCVQGAEALSCPGVGCAQPRLLLPACMVHCSVAPEGADFHARGRWPRQRHCRRSDGPPAITWHTLWPTYMSNALDMQRSCRASFSLARPARGAFACRRRPMRHLFASPNSPGRHCSPEPPALLASNLLRVVRLNVRATHVVLIIACTLYLCFAQRYG